MTTRVACPNNGWYVMESVDEIEALIDPPAPEPEYLAEIGQWTHHFILAPRFISLMIDPAYVGNKKMRIIRLAVASIVCLEEMPSKDGVDGS